MRQIVISYGYFNKKSPNKLVYDGNLNDKISVCELAFIYEDGRTTYKVGGDNRPLRNDGCDGTTMVDSIWPWAKSTKVRADVHIDIDNGERLYGMITTHNTDWVNGGNQSIEYVKSIQFITIKGVK